MSDQPKDAYGLEPERLPPPIGAPTPGAGMPRAGRPMTDAGASSSSSSPNAKPAQVPIEEDELPPALRPVKDLDVCPNCGAPMNSVDEIVCLRCGFDLKTMKQVSTARGVVEVEPEQAGSIVDDETQPLRKSIVTAGRGDAKVPLIMAAVAGLILILGYLGGAPGLFSPVADVNGDIIVNPVTTFGARMLGLLKFLISDAMWTISAVGSLAFLAFLLSMRLGDPALAAARMLGIVTAAHLVTFINFNSNTLEFSVEAVLQAAIFVGLTIMLFNLRPKDAPTLLGGTVILYLVLRLGAWIVESLG